MENFVAKQQAMKPISFKRHRFHPDVIRQAVWLYYRFTLSLRDVEDLLAERGIDVTYETIRCWADKFGPAIAANIRKRRRPADRVWHLDEMIVKIGGKSMFMWRAVDKEGEVLDVLVQKRRNKAAALKLLKKLLKHQGFAPDAIVTDGLASYRAALRELGGLKRHQPTQRSTISSIPSVTSSQERQCEPSETALLPSGKLCQLQLAKPP
jgi:transposase-like protein